ncbi:hypothetical protein LQ938_14950 [Microbacterium sp. cx-55]|nr:MULTISPECIES: hypothetical protein [unclassified Microbacterium]UGB35134.1 hypothetical protein LQ938_14950 [Microbacterium sp. cx-55]
MSIVDNAHHRTGRRREERENCGADLISVWWRAARASCGHLECVSQVERKSREIVLQITEEKIDGGVREVCFGGEAGQPKDSRVACLAPREKFIEKCCLADPRVAYDDESGRIPALGSTEECAESLEVIGPAHEECRIRVDGGRVSKSVPASDYPHPPGG